VPKTNNVTKLEDFVLLKNTKKKIDFRYYAVRGQTAYVNKKSNKKINEDYYMEVLRINNVANAVNLWNRLNEHLRKKVEKCGNEMNLISITEEQFITTITDVYEKRKLINITNDSDSE